MEECSILIIGPGVKYFLVPYHSSAGRRYIDQFQPVCISYQIVGEYDSALQTGIRPFCRIWICDIQSRNGYGLDLVGMFWHHSPDGFLILFAEDGRHGGSCSAVV